MKTSITTSCKQALLALLCICSPQAQAQNTLSWSKFSAPVRANTQIKKSFSRKILTWGGVSLATAVIAYVLLTKVRAHKQGPASSCWEIMKNDWRGFKGLFSKRRAPAPAIINLDKQADDIITTLGQESADALTAQEAQELLNNPALSPAKAQKLRTALQHTENTHSQAAGKQQDEHTHQPATQQENKLNFEDIQRIMEKEEGNSAVPLYNSLSQKGKAQLKADIFKLVPFASSDQKALMTKWVQKINRDNDAESASQTRANYNRLSKIAENLGGLENDAQRAEARALIPLLESEDEKNTVRGWL